MADVSVQIDASHERFTSVVRPTLDRLQLSQADRLRYGVAKIVLDFPLTWALGQLDHLNSIERAHTLVVTQGTHPVYQDCIGGHHLSGVVAATDENALISAIFAAANAQRTFYCRSDLTYMELRVVRLLLRGQDTREVADGLRVSYKTVNAHVSNVLCKLGYSSRAQMVARVMGNQ